MVILLAVGAGLILGSFLSVVLERLDRREGIVAGRSECPHCHHVLAWYDLVPLVSYVVLGGRCRYCRARISPLYPVLEVTMAAVLGAYAASHGLAHPGQVMDAALLFGLVALFFFDLRYQILPDVLVYSIGTLALVRLILFWPDMLVSASLAAVVLGSVFGLLYVFSRGRWLGFGDVKLAVVVGLLFGYPAAIGVTLLAIWVGALWGVGLMLVRRANMQTALPFGSFWTAVAIITYIWPVPINVLTSLLTLHP